VDLEGSGHLLEGQVRPWMVSATGAVHVSAIEEKLLHQPVHVCKSFVASLEFPLHCQSAFFLSDIAWLVHAHRSKFKSS
jgi:hypothetical protein